MKLTILIVLKKIMKWTRKYWNELIASLWERICEYFLEPETCRVILLSSHQVFTILILYMGYQIISEADSRHQAGPQGRGRSSLSRGYKKCLHYLNFTTERTGPSSPVWRMEEISAVVALVRQTGRDQAKRSRIPSIWSSTTSYRQRGWTLP